MKKVYVLLADGFELIEALTPVDVLRRGGIDVKTVSITSEKNIMSAQEVLVKADTTLKETDIKDGDMLVLPGGYPGYVNLGNSNEVVELVKFYVNNGKFVGAICGAPSILGNHDIAPGKKVTCHTSIKNLMKNYQYEEKNHNFLNPTSLSFYLFDQHFYDIKQYMLFLCLNSLIILLLAYFYITYNF